MNGFIIERIMMKKLLAICLFIISAPSFAEEVYEIRDANADAMISIFNPAGEVKVVGWSRKQVEVEADLGSGVKELIFESDGDQVTIEVKVPGHNSRNISSDLVVKVPEGSSLKIATVSADISVVDVRGRQTIESVSGNIETAVFAADVDIESVSGDVEVEGDNKKIRTRVESVSGDIDLQGLDGFIEVGSVSGDMVLYNSKFETVEIQTVSGDLTYKSGLYGDSRLSAESVSGDVDIKFTGKVSARFDIESFAGAIRNCFGPEPVRTSKYTPGLELQFKQGKGRGRVEIQTLSGDVRLCRD